MTGMRGWLFAAAVVLAAAPALAGPPGTLSYPQPPRANVVDTYWGTPVPDPYRPLEDATAPPTRAWLREEAALTHKYLDALPYRAEVRAAFERLYATSTYQAALERHGAFWTTSRAANGKRNVIYVRDGESGPDRPLLDANQLAPNVAVAYVDWSRSGRLMAYATQTNGSDWLTWRVRDVATATDLPDVVRWGKYVDVAFNGNDGFYYSGYDAPADGRGENGAPNASYKAFYHRLGTPQSADVLIAAAPNASAFPATNVTLDGRYAVMTFGPPERNGYDIFPAAQPGAPRRTVIEPGDGARYIGSAGSQIFFRVHTGSPNGRIVAVDADNPAQQARTMVPERADPLAGASFIGDRFYLNYLHDVHNVLEIADVQGRRSGTISLPGLGTATAPLGDAGDGFTYYTYESFTQPRTTYRYDLKTGRSTVAVRDPAPFDPTPFVTEQLFATSKDGTRVPVFVTHRRDMRYDGSTPTIMWGYAAYGDLYATPAFYYTTAVWLQMGGAYATVSARGGGELGEAWHRAGMLDQKQHGFDDVIAAAELLNARKIASPQKLAVTGASMGGLLVGAVVTQRPDLFGAGIPSAAPLDMLRAQKFTAGAGMETETGTSDQSEAAFRTLRAYSPLHNVRAGVRYPAMYITTGDHDDRVVPAHSYKFAAALQQAQAGDAPILLRVVENAGHDYAVAGTGAARVTDRFAFLVQALGMKPAFAAP